jgi:hypothetical protein
VRVPDYDSLDGAEVTNEFDEKWGARRRLVC